MCGRFALHHPAGEITARFGIEQVALELSPRFNIAPSQPVAIIRQRQHRTLEECKWGLVPVWAKDPAIGNRLINARAETLSEKPAYRAAFRYRRCLIPASGFYEWKKEGKNRIPTYIYLKESPPFALAGLWEEWRTPEGDLLPTCTIVTTQANPFMAPIHSRMPLILAPDQEPLWLDPQVQDPARLAPLLQPYPPEEMAAHPVSRQVNTATFDNPACILPVA